MITICIPIVDGAKRVEALLPGGVPDGKVDSCSVDVQPLAQERRYTTRRMKIRNIRVRQLQEAHKPCIVLCCLSLNTLLT
jgi:hypothetical protein